MYKTGGFEHPKSSLLQLLPHSQRTDQSSHLPHSLPTSMKSTRTFSTARTIREGRESLKYHRARHLNLAKPLCKVEALQRYRCFSNSSTSEDSIDAKVNNDDNNEATKRKPRSQSESSATSAILVDEPIGSLDQAVRARLTSKMLISKRVCQIMRLRMNQRSKNVLMRMTNCGSKRTPITLMTTETVLAGCPPFLTFLAAATLVVLLVFFFRMSW